MRTKILSTIAVALLLVTAGCAGFAGGSPSATTPSAPEDGAAGTAVGQTGPEAGTVGEVQPAATSPALQTGAQYDNFSALYNATIDSVVEVSVQTARGQGQGSGFVFNESGYIVTNQHVVANAQEVLVRFRPDVWRQAEVVGTDVYTDLAVLKVDSLPEGVEALPLAENNAVPGQPVAAMGSPFGLQGSITHGIVSGTNRSMPVAGGFSIPDTIQTDAPINPGNSGGPLLSMSGKVVGVNRATAGDNIGFAISADVVEEVVPELIQNGSYPNAYLGIQTAPLTPAAQQINDLNVSDGVVVTGVLEGGPAEGELQPATLQRGPEGQAAYTGGDIILSIENRSIENYDELSRYLLFETHPGEEVQVTVLRGDERRTVTITIGERPKPSTFGYIGRSR